MVWGERELTEKNKKKLVQCPFCPLCMVGQARLAVHIVSAHPEIIEYWIKGRSDET